MTPEQAYRRLQKRARDDGRPTGEYLTLYALERFVARLVDSKFRDDFVLKGGLLLAAHDMRRPTRDIDAATDTFPMEIAALEEAASEIGAIELGDGANFCAPTHSETIRESDLYPGIRLTLPVSIHTFVGQVKIDFSVTTDITPTPSVVTLRGLLGDDVQVRGYALETVIAEKGVTILQRGSTSTRWRDYVDLVTIARGNAFDFNTLRIACDAVAEARAVSLSPVTPFLSTYDELSQSKWRAWRSKSELESISAESLTDQLDAVAQFLDPLFGDGTQAVDRTWDPIRFAWIDA